MGWKPLVLGILFAAAAFPAGTVSIQGGITDADTGLPVTDAEVVLRFASSSAAISTVKTGQSGAYRFDISDAGSYVIEASAQGFVGTQYRTLQPPIEIVAADFADTTAGAERKRDIALARVGSISGELKDGATQQPLAGFTVKALRAGWSRGKRVFDPQGLTNTDETGVFHLEIQPGDYILQIWKAPLANRIVDGRQPDYGPKTTRPGSYPLVFWPAGDPLTALPISVASGSETRVGSLNLSKATLGRIRSSIPLSQCAEGGLATVAFDLLAVHDNALRGSLQVPCGSAFTITDLSPGDYTVKALTMEGGQTGGAAYTLNAPSHFVLMPGMTSGPLPKTASADVHIVEGSDSDLDLVFASVVELTTKIRCECAEAWELSIRDLQVAFDQAMFRGSSPFLNHRGVWRISMPEPSSVKLKGLPRGFAFKEVISQGRSTGSVFVPAPGVSRQIAEIVLTDKAPQFAARVSRDDKPASGAQLVFAQWPLTRFEDFPIFDAMTCDAEGICLVAGIGPGAYRVAAVAPADWEKRDMPGVVEDWLSRGEAVSLEDGEVKAIRIAMTSAP